MKKRSKVILGILAMVLILVIASFWMVKSKMENGLEHLAAAPIAAVDFSQIPDGVYEGEYAAIPVAAVVAVTVQDGKVLAIDLLRHDNGQGKAAEVIPDHVVQAQSLQVDVITGATYSSKAILKAIEMALEQSNP
jgi:uncharacterized protein with FMN-binding domain